LFAALHRHLSKIGARILIVLAIPVVGLLMLAGQVMWDRHTTATEMKELSRLVELSTRMSGLVHELQRERGSSAVFLGSKGQRFQTELEAQRRATDVAHTALMAVLLQDIDMSRRDALGETMRNAAELLSGLGARRAAVTVQLVTGSANTAAFTAMIMPMIDAIGRIVSQSADTTVTQALTIFYNLEQAKERAGRERALGALGFSKHALDPALFRNFMSTVAEEDAYFRSYDVFATPEDRALLAKVVTGPDVAEMLNLRNMMLDTPIDGRLSDVASDHWFHIATIRIDLIREVENSIADRMTTVAHAARDNATRAFWAATAVVATLLVLGGVVGALTARGIVRPVTAMTTAMLKLASGDRTVEIPAQGRHDEIGEMAKAVAVFKQTAIENDRLTETTIQEHARLARLQDAMDEHTQDFGASISGVMEGLVQHAGQLHAAAQAMSDAAANTSSATTVAADDSAASVRDLSAVTSAADEMSRSTDEISRQVAQVTDVVREAVAHATATDQKVGSLADSAQKIVGVVRLIRAIAGQTNLLALNATIESARAGEAGKGFVVVAGEVKALAKQTALATEQISAQIDEIVAATADAKQAVRTVAQAIGQVDTVAGAIYAAVERQAAATQAIGQSAHTLSSASEEAGRAMDTVRIIAGQTDAASGRVMSVADEVGHTAAALRIEVTDFLDAMCRHDGDRRAYERLPGDGTTASLNVCGHEPVTAEVHNISRGGVALRCSLQAIPGAEATVELSRASQISGRIVRLVDGNVIVAFHQSVRNLATIDEVLAAIRALSDRQAA
jgi:methyl-accepting chemotaxis protein